MEGLRAGLGVVKVVQSKVKEDKVNRANMTVNVKKRGEVKGGTR